jgi:hypothetical protein
MSRSWWRSTNKREAVMRQALSLVLQFFETLRAVAFIVTNKVNACTRQAGVGWAVRDVTAEMDSIGADDFLVTLITFAMVILGLFSNWFFVVNTNTMTALVTSAIIDVEARRQWAELTVSLADNGLVHVILCQSIQCVPSQTIVVVCLTERCLAALGASLSELESWRLATNNRFAFLNTLEC